MIHPLPAAIRYLRSILLTLSPPVPPIPLPRFTARSALLAAAALALLPACNNVEKAKPRPESSRADTINIKMDVPQMMRGTIASETIVLGYEDVVVRGYGLVVGLKGTGSRTLNAQIRAYMLNYMRKLGVGAPGDAEMGITPESLLSSPDTAVVIVEAVIPAGSVKGSRFDVRVMAEPSSDTTSLEGGRLYTTELRPGPLLVGRGLGRESQVIATAKGDIFVNPFAEPDAVGRDTVNRTIGRILHGGVSARDLPIKLRISTPSHARAATIQQAVNSLFPREPGQRDPTARGESDTAIKITIPPSWHDRTREFIEVLQHSTIRLDAIEQTAMNIQRTLQSNPGAGADAAWRWQALGKRSIPIIQELYEYPEESPRLSALQAGAKLDDAQAVNPLLDMAASAAPARRIEAIALLGGMRLNPRIDMGLRDLLDDDDIDVRLAVFEALLKRGDPTIRRISVDDKFELVLAPSKKPLVYISQSGIPRISVFDPDLAIARPTFVSAWSDRFMIKDHASSDRLEVYYRRVDQESGDIHLITPILADFIPFLGHATTIERPKPGLALTYAETVGALHQIWLQKYLPAEFRAEQDRVLAAILKAQEGERAPERPEFGDPDFDYLNPEDAEAPAPTGTPSDPENATPTDRPEASSVPGLEGDEGIDWAPPPANTPRP